MAPGRSRPRREDRGRAPAVTMPLLAVGGLPVGVQIMGQQHEDARMTAMARWMLGTITPVCV